MTGDIELFFKIRPFKYDRSVTKVQGIGTLKIINNFILKHVLFVHNLECNLLSVGKIAIDLNYCAKFSHGCCVF